MFQLRNILEIFNQYQHNFVFILYYLIIFFSAKIVKNRLGELFFLSSVVLVSTYFLIFSTEWKSAISLWVMVVLSGGAMFRSRRDYWFLKRRVQK